MTNLPVYAGLIYDLASVATDQLGQTYALYRMNTNTTGSIISGKSLLNRSFGMYFEKASKKNIENATFDIQVFEAIANANHLKVGDILVENGPGSDNGKYCVAQVRYRKPFRTMLVRVESSSAIERPHPDTGAAENQPTSGMVYDPTKYAGIRPGGRYELTLDNGNYLMLPQGSGTLASIPVGIQPTNRISGDHKPNLPTEIPNTRFWIYVPPGFVPQELDLVKGVNQDTYSIQMIYTSDGVGLAGTICLAGKLPT